MEEIAVETRTRNEFVDVTAQVEAIKALGSRKIKSVIPVLVEGLIKARTLGDKNAFFDALSETAEAPVPSAALDNLGSLPLNGTDAQRKALKEWLEACLGEVSE